MTTYVAFLRGINVGGHTVKMDALRELLSQLGLSDIRTFIQSGNVFFASSELPEHLERRIAEHLEQALGYAVPTFVRTIPQLEKVIDFTEFRDIEPKEDERHMVLFTSHREKVVTDFPQWSVKRDAELVGDDSGTLFVRTHLIQGKPIDPTKFLESYYGKFQNTGRFYHTLKKIVEAAKMG
jgi:uncharacterized protein (DUF1697 family)